MALPEFYIFDLSLDEGGKATKPLDIYDAHAYYKGDPLGFAMWELRRAKGWANLIALNWPEALQVMSDGHRELLSYETQEYCRAAAIVYVQVCECRLRKTQARLENKEKRGRAIRTDPKLL